MKRFLSLILLLPFFVTAQVLTVDQNQLNFGSVNDTTMDSLSVILTNTSNSDITVNQVKFYNTYNSTPFSVANDNFTILANSSKTIWVRFQPSHNILHNSEMLIKHTANSGYTSVDLIGQGVYSKTYYAASQNTSEEQLKLALKNIITTGMATNKSYNEARDEMFMVIDNKKVNGQNATTNTLECIYTGTVKTGYTSRSDAQNTSPQFNTEHTFPQGFFSSNLPMRSDLHHLFPTTNSSNSSRSNSAFGVVTNGTATGGGSFYTSNLFEPRDAQKGASARALLYFVIRYQDYNNHLSTYQNIIKQWHTTFLPDTIETKRNQDIFTFQGNRNPFVDYPQLADRITNFVVNSSAPSIFSMDVTQSSINFGTVSIDTLFNYTLVNTGNQDILLTNIILSDTSQLQFANQLGSSDTLKVGEAFVFPIQLLVNSFGAVNETLSFNTNIAGAQSSLSIPISANIVTSLGEITLENQISIFPNPSHHNVTISLPSTIQILKIEIYNQAGQLIKSDFTKDNQLNIEKIKSGLYFTKIQTTKGIVTKKLMVD